MQLQLQALRQAAGADAGGLQVLQQAQGDAQVVQQRLIGFASAGACEVGGERIQGFFKVAVVAQRFDQEVQRCAVVLAQAQRQRLAVQVRGQGLVAVGAAAGVELLVVFARAGLARSSLKAPFAVGVGAVDGAFALPVGGLVIGIILGPSACWISVSSS